MPEKQTNKQRPEESSARPFKQKKLATVPSLPDIIGIML